MKKVSIGCDHGGYELKLEVIKNLKEKGYEIIDFGCDSTDSVDYPDYAVPVCNSVVNGEADCAILICGTGIGMSMCANKVHGIRAALCHDTFSARMTRMHNNANVLCMGARVVGPGLANDIVNLFLTVDFEGDRHLRRINKVMAIEK